MFAFYLHFRHTSENRFLHRHRCDGQSRAYKSINDAKAIFCPLFDEAFLESVSNNREKLRASSDRNVPGIFELT